MTTQLKVLSAGKPSDAEKSPILEVRDLALHFKVNGSVLPILENIGLCVQPGEMMCVLGPSGCGKTTLLNVLAGFLKPSTGQVLAHDRPISGPGPDRCVVFQEDALFPWLTVAENIGFGLKGKSFSRRQRREMVERYLNLVGLLPFGGYLHSEISGGMRQRVALARVLILEPAILLMDEPFVALDSQTRQEMQQLLLSLWKRFSHTVVFVTHDVREAVTLADRVVMMDKNPGRVKKVVEMDLQRPRDPAGNLFHRQCGRLDDLLRRR
ncbi:MAG: ABC transporter ATP-binding protein [Desulfosalsimonas sp.]|uniref:ABC transporter ATP-binding protein n=1 Tax=Desulfosalsimonas sp. TaxID=3073848 RepID=UPI00397062B3